jgi:hypothetical protein
MLVVFCGWMFTGCRKQDGHIISNTRLPVYCEDTLFNKAFIEMKAMLDGKIPLNFKRAVFLSEYAYCGNEINYDQFTKEIEVTATKLRQFMKERKIEEYKTAGNFAIFEYMTKPCTMNGYKPMDYDDEDFLGEKDWRSTFVTKLMRTRKGNCHSLPYYYKILANEIEANAHLAFAPNHVYIKHHDEERQWVNVELTNGTISSDEWLITSGKILPDAVKNKIYLDAITERQSIASCMFDLAQSYAVKYEDPGFVLLCSNTILQYHPNNIQTLLLKHNILNRKLLVLKSDKKKDMSPEAKVCYQEMMELRELIKNLGYRMMTRDEYMEWMYGTGK